MLSISLRRVALLHRDRVVDVWGEWPATPLLSASSEPGGEPFELPERTPSWARKLLARDSDVQVGCRTVNGPLALPASWSADGRLAHTSAELMALAGALPDGPGPST